MMGADHLQATYQWSQVRKHADYPQLCIILLQNVQATDTHTKLLSYVHHICDSYCMSNKESFWRTWTPVWYSSMCEVHAECDESELPSCITMLKIAEYLADRIRMLAGSKNFPTTLFCVACCVCCSPADHSQSSSKYAAITVRPTSKLIASSRTYQLMQQLSSNPHTAAAHMKEDTGRSLCYNIRARCQQPK